MYDMHNTSPNPPAGQGFPQLMPETGTTQSEYNGELKLAEELQGAHFFEWRFDKPEATSSPDFKRLFGIPEIEPLTADAVMSRVHPLDAERVRNGQASVLQKAEPFEDEFRVLLPNGATRWVLARGEPITAASGEIVGLAGTNLDITHRKVKELQLARREAMLREREDMLRTLADAMPQMVWSARPDGYHDYFNAKWYEFTGVATGSTFGEGWNDIFHPEDRERAKTLWKQALTTGQPYEIEYRLKHHAGEYRWTLGRALPFRNADGQIVRWFGTCTDIHDAKIHAEQMVMLGHELKHRIKNIFSVIQGVIGLTARLHPEAQNYASNLREKISALSRAHSLVHMPFNEAEASDRLSLKSLLREILSPYPALEEGRIHISGDDVELRPKAITALALVFHELATNASKYGALANSVGELVINVRKGSDKIDVHWSEVGGPPIAGSPSRTGFGTKLSVLSIERQLN